MKLDELLEYAERHSITDETHFPIDRMMFYRYRSIKERPELLAIAKKRDKQMLLF